MSPAARKALFVAGVYALAAGLYIVFSSRVAAAVAPDVQALERIERIKGVAFVAVTSGVLFVATRFVLLRAEADARIVAAQREAIVAVERQATAGLTAAGVAHDANNVLTALLGELSLIEDELGERTELVNARHAAERLVALNRRLQTAAKATHDAALDVDLAQVLEEVRATFRPHKALRRCKLTVVAEPGAVVKASVVLLTQIVGNLLVNAGEATSGEGRVELRLLPSASTYTIEVHDDGPGVPASRRPHLFEALVTTKAHGTGLGLYSARACAVAAGCELTVDDSPLGGACFRLLVPRARS